MVLNGQGQVSRDGLKAFLELVNDGSTFLRYFRMTIAKKCSPYLYFCSSLYTNFFTYSNVSKYIEGETWAID